MHGTNKLRPGNYREEGLLQVHEIWYTIQGEGMFSGWPAVFLRLSGCNLACHFCDTEWDDEKDPLMTPREIMDKINEVSKDTRCQLLVITGGEPFRQNFAPLVKILLKEKNWDVQVETNGALWDEVFEDVVSRIHVVTSPKSAKVREQIRETTDLWKYIIRQDEVDEDDGLPIVGWKKDTPIRVARPEWKYVELQDILVQPCEEGNPEDTKANHELAAKIAMKYGYRISVQIHKILGVP